MGGMGIAGIILVVWLGFAALCAAFGLSLARRAWKKRKATPRALTIVTAVIAGAVLFGAIGSLLGLVKALGAVGADATDPAQKARVLAEGIAQAMNCTAFGFAVAIPCGIFALVLARTNGRSR